jgi:hypothetical protein
MVSAKQLKHDLGNALAENVMEYIKDKPKDILMKVGMHPNPYYFGSDDDKHQLGFHYSQETGQFNALWKYVGLGEQEEPDRHISSELTWEHDNLHILTLSTSFGSARYEIDVKYKSSRLSYMTGMNPHLFNIIITLVEYDPGTGSDTDDDSVDDDSDDDDSDNDSDNDP